MMTQDPGKGEKDSSSGESYHNELDTPIERARAGTISKTAPFKEVVRDKDSCDFNAGTTTGEK
jgi:hypothetical protein